MRDFVIFRAARVLDHEAAVAGNRLSAQPPPCYLTADDRQARRHSVHNESSPLSQPCEESHHL